MKCPYWGYHAVRRSAIKPYVPFASDKYVVVDQDRPVPEGLQRSEKTAAKTWNTWMWSIHIMYSVLLLDKYRIKQRHDQDREISIQERDNIQTPLSRVLYMYNPDMYI